MKSVAFVTVCVAIVGGLSMAQAQTFDELKAAVEAADDGATVHVTSDMTFDSQIVVGSGKSVVLEGWDSEGNVATVRKLTRSLDYKEGAFFATDGGGRKLTIKNVVLDLQCNKRERQLTRRVIQVMGTDCRFTLGAGAKICNVYQTGDYPGTMYAGPGGIVVMEEGSEISDAYCYAYGAAVQVGRGGGGCFVMNGGLITDCHGPDFSGNDPVWGGAVHVYGGQFKFNGGLITGNVSPHHTGGVVLYRGKATDTSAGMMFCGGSGAITGNVGKVANDVYCVENKSNIWLVNQTYTENTTHYKGAVMTIRCGDTVPVAGETCMAVTMQASSSASAFLAADIGNVSLQDNPSLALDPASIGKAVVGQEVSKYLTVWRPKLADIVANGKVHNRFTVADVWSAISGTKAVASFWQDFERNTSGPLDFNGDSDITLRSMGEERKRFSVPANDLRGLMFLHQPAAGHPKKVRFENLIVDGNSQNGAICPGGSEGFIWLQRDCALELGPGAMLCNVYCPSNRAGIVAVSKSRFAMEAGSVVSNVVAGSWNSAITVGADSATSDPTVFDMSGGLITACETRGPGEPKNGNGGAVTVRRAQMNMSGGAIIGNKATGNTSSGVLLYKGLAGEINLSGDARICDNTGLFPDLFISQAGVNFSGDFRGLVGVCDSSLSLDVNPAAGATGAWCFYKSSNTPANHKKVWGYVEEGTFKWGTPGGWIDGCGFVQTSDIDVRLADAEDISTPEARAKLPHVLAGTALNGNISQTLTFGVKDMCESGELPLMLYAFQDGDFTGTVNVSTPIEGKYRCCVSKSTIDGVSGLCLVRDVLGMLLLIR